MAPPLGPAGLRSTLAGEAYLLPFPIRESALDLLVDLPVTLPLSDDSSMPLFLYSLDSSSSWCSSSRGSRVRDYLLSTAFFLASKDGLITYGDPHSLAGTKVLWSNRFMNFLWIIAICLSLILKAFLFARPLMVANWFMSTMSSSAISMLMASRNVLSTLSSIGFCPRCWSLKFITPHKILKRFFTTSSDAW